MDIKSLPEGARCLVDANILIYHFGNLSPECSDFIARVVRREVEAHLTTVVIAEVLHRRMMLEAVANNPALANQTLKKLKSNPGIVASLTDYITEVEELLKLPFRKTTVTATDIQRSHDLRRGENLFVNDSLNLAAALRRGITNIVTHDADFNRIVAINVWEPTDI